MTMLIRKVLCFVIAFGVCMLCSCQAVSNSDIVGGAPQPVSLATASGADKIPFDGSHVEISVHTDEDYYFSNRNVPFCEKFAAFLENVMLSEQTTPSTDSDYVYVSVNRDNQIASFSVYDTDVVGVIDIEGTEYYYCEGVYDRFADTFSSFLEENREYCRSATTTVLLKNEYAVYDKNYNVLESDSIVKTPHLFYDDGIVHLWVQTGTGVLTRWAKFFDVESGKTSPIYYGQTDYFADTVCATESSKVSVYDMFSGDLICVFDQFDKPLGDNTENVLSAYFTSDGTQITVQYVTADDYAIATQTFDLPKQ